MKDWQGPQLAGWWCRSCRLRLIIQPVGNRVEVKPALTSRRKPYLRIRRRGSHRGNVGPPLTRWQVAKADARTRPLGLSR